MERHASVSCWRSPAPGSERDSERTRQPRLRVRGIGATCAPVLGQCGGVGSGLVLGGGLGWLSGRHGATCDNLVSAHIVTAEGRSLTADSVTNPDLFWAIRGGGGNFGIATSLEYQLYPLKEVLAGSLVYPINRAASILRLFRELMSTAPDDLQADCYLTTRNAAAKLNVVYSGRLDKGEQLLNTFRSANTPDQDSMKRTSFSEIYQMFGADEPASCPLALDKGTYVEKLSDEVIDLVVGRLRQSPPSCETVFNFSHYMHGQVCRVSPDATAFGGQNIIKGSPSQEHKCRHARVGRPEEGLHRV